MAFFAKRVSSEIRKLLESLNEDNYDAVVDQLSQYIEHGTEESILLVETCLDHFKIYEEDLKSTHLEPVVASLFRKLLEKPHFSRVFSGFLRRTTISEEFLDNLSSALQLSAYEKLGFGLALLDSEKNDVRTAGRNFCMAQFEELHATHASLDTADCVHKGLRFLEQSEIFSKHVDSFMQMILQIWLNENSGFILAPQHSDQLHDSKLRMLVFPSSTAINYSIPIAAVCGNVWENNEGQFPFLKNAVRVSPEASIFAHSRRQLEYADAENNHKFHADHASHPWLSIDHLEHLCLLAESGHETSVRSMLEITLKHCPEELLIGIAHIITPFNLLQCEVSSIVLPMLLKDDSKREIVLNLWHVNPVFFSRALTDALNSDPRNTNRVVNLLEDLQILSSVLDLVPMSLGIRLAALASLNEFIDLEEWLSTNLSTYEDIFFEECLRFLKVVEVDAQDSSDCGEILSVYKETAPTFLKVLQLHTSLLVSNQLSEEVKRLYVTCMHNGQRMKNVGGPNSSTSEIYEDDIEKEVNFYFQQMFSGQLTVDAMVQTLTQFKGSSEKREQSVFECMINNLFEVYKFINKYPDEELKIVAVLFGLLIRHRLLSHPILGISLQAVLDALHEPADSKMFVFATKALESFVDCLIEWPDYSQKILQISHLHLTHPGLVLVIEQTLAGTSSSHPESAEGHNSGTNQHHSSSPPANVEMTASSLPLTGDDGGQIDSQVCSPIQLHQRSESHLDERQKASSTSSSDTNPNLSTSGQVSVTSSGSVSIQKPQSVVKSSAATSSSPGFSSPSRAVTSARFGSASSIGTLLAAAERRETPIEAPPSETQDRISFIINTLSAANIEAKAKEFTEIIEEQYYPWFGHYIVMNRVSIEPNFHMLYLNLLEKANSTRLNEEVVRATYENCKVLLRSELIKSSVEERSLLKNLGGWLGRITIGRNRVLRSRDIDPKSLLLEAYEEGLMIGVIPFISKILEPCQSSLAYQPPNPWTMGILGLLAEIHAMPNLKVNLKFEIEVLFKNLDMDLKAITPTSLLKGRVRKFEGNPDFSNKDVGSSQQHVVEEVNSTMRSDKNQVELPPEASGPSYQGGHSHVLYQHAAPLHLPALSLGEDEKTATLGLCNQLPPAQGHQVAQLPLPVTQLPAPTLNIPQQVNVNPELQPSHLDMHFQRVLPLAMDNAIKEIVSSIVQKSASIASHTTVELILKEYDTELDENCIREASCMMVVHLAGNLAYVTCKEPLRRSISTQLRNLLQGSNVASQFLEQAIQRVTHDNLDLGCASIEKAATDKGITMVQRELAQQLSLRRKHREGDRPATFFPNLPAQGNVGALPEAFYPQSGHLSHPQQQVYEDFVPLPGQNFSQHSNTLLAVPLVPCFRVSLPQGYALGSGQLNPGIFSSHLGNSGINATALSLDPVDTERGSLRFSSASSIHTMMASNSHPCNNENEDVLPSFPSVPAPQSHVLEPSNVAKELGIHEQPLLPPSGSERLTSNTVEPSLATDTALDIYQFLSKKLELLIANDAKEAEIQSVIAEVPTVILRCISKDEAALAVAQKVFECLYQNANNAAYVDAHLAILAAICDVSELVRKELTSWVLHSDDDRKFNKYITVGLIHRELLNLAEYNVHMAKLIDAGKKGMAAEFCISLIQTLQASDARVISELHNVVDALAKVTAPVANRDDNLASESSKLDPPDFLGQVSMVLTEWCQIWDRPGVDDAVRAHYVLQLNRNVLSKADDMPNRFFRLLLELAVSHYLASEGINSSQSQLHQQADPFLVIDLYADLVFSILKFCAVDQGPNKLSLLSKVLAVIVKFIKKDVEEKKTSFCPNPYLRLFMNFLFHLGTLNAIIDDANFQVLTALSSYYHALQPMRVPAFSFAWLELVSHKDFMPKILTANGQKGWPYFERLLIDLLQFMEPFLRTGELAEPVRVLYIGTLRVLLVLLHDFPEFLCYYYFSFCDVIAPRCIQLRNIIISAFPKNMRIPDPNTLNLKVDLLVEMSQPPCILSEFDAVLKANKLKSVVDEYIMMRPEGSSFLSELKYKLRLSSSEAERCGTSYNVPLMNSLVLYVGTQAIQKIQASTASHPTCMARYIPLSAFLAGAAFDIFQTLILELDSEGRYIFFNAVANQLRYPNNHTHYFSFVMLYFFGKLNQESIQELIIRVLLERLITKRPHPWGALVTFLELVKNPKYNFWNLSFTRCAPEIEKVFDSVSESCGLTKPEDASGSGA